MLIRAAIALEDDVQAQALQRALIAASLRSFDSEAPGAARSADYEIDIAICHNDWDALRGMAGDLDLIFLSYPVLAQHRAALRQLVHGNPLGFRIAVGEPEADICRYLAVQPAGHMRSALDESAVAGFCALCARELAQYRHVLQLRTKGGSYAISCASILYGMSDQKHVLIRCADDRIFRRTGKLDQLQEVPPPSFVRVHQSYLVNRSHVTGIERSSWELLLDNGEHIPVSRAYRKIISELFSGTAGSAGSITL